jgi:hypothetical protein
MSKIGSSRTVILYRYVKGYALVLVEAFACDEQSGYALCGHYDLGIVVDSLWRYMAVSWGGGEAFGQSGEHAYRDLVV